MTDPTRVVTRRRAGTATLAPGTRIGTWVLDQRIGVGGMGTVYAAQHAVIGKRAALKIVHADLCADPAITQRFLQEARVVNQIAHPNVVDIFDVGEHDDGRPYLVMELLCGRTLAARIDEGGLLAPEACDVLEQACDALTAAHAQSVVHRDLKPDNIFLVDGGARVLVKLVDWGISKQLGALPLGIHATAAGTFIGTPQYVAPEQARGKPVDGRTDVYSLGALAYELFLARPPFSADNLADLLAMHLREPPPSPRDRWPGIPRELERLLLAMLAKAPGQRPSSAEVKTTLERVRGQLAAAGRGPGAGRRLAAGSGAPFLPGFERARD